MKRISAFLLAAVILGCEEDDGVDFSQPIYYYCEFTDPRLLGAECANGVDVEGNDSTICDSNGGVYKWLCQKEIRKVRGRSK
jgi:hypothetical protein